MTDSFGTFSQESEGSLRDFNFTQESTVASGRDGCLACARKLTRSTKLLEFFFLGGLLEGVAEGIGEG